MTHKEIRIDCKEGITFSEFQDVHPNLLILLSFFFNFGIQHGLPITITSIMDEADGRVSRSHAEGRAFDGSTRGWSLDEIDDLVYEANSQFKDIAAISSSDLVPRAVIFHKVEGGAYHLHFQVKP